MASKERLFVVDVTNPNGEATTFLVMADKASKARNFIADRFVAKARAATPTEVYTLAASKVPIERAE